MTTRSKMTKAVNEDAKPQDQRVNTSGRGRSLAVGKVLPKDWDWVRVTVVETTKTEITVKIRKLVIKEAK